ncbi:cobaltochelatase subunit CobT [bacterium]|nr:cobaltochelatase subunit CobT [bacterium]
MKNQRRHAINLDARREAIAAVTRALAGDRKLDVGYGSQHGQGSASGSSFQLPSLPDNPTPTQLANVRAAGDALALWHKYHQANIYRQHLPESRKARDILDALERARVESIGAEHMKGVADNIRLRTELRCLKNGYGNLSDKQEPPLGEILALMLRRHLTGEKPPSAMKKLMAQWEPWILSRIGHGLDQLSQKVHEPAGFLTAASALLQKLGMGARQSPTEGNDDDKPDEESSSPAPQDGNADDEEDSKTEQESMQASAPPGPIADLELEQQQTDSEGVDQDQQEALPAPYIPNTHAAEFDFISSHYHVFTRAFDEVVAAEKLVSADELRGLRAKLDQKLAGYNRLAARLSNQLQRLLLAKQRRGWAFEQEEGLLDAARLSRLVVSPWYHSIYKQETEVPFRDTVVTLLLDNSGSMRGRPIMVAAMSSDILSRTLERAGIKVEILGFTTRDWKGGQARKRWQSIGSPLSGFGEGGGGPGRLNDLRHIIYKTADTPLRRARANLGLMLKEGLLKENIDGEAILWAHERLLKRPEQRKILMVISDGAPVDDSTLSVNHSGYLDSHLREVIQAIEQNSPVELLAIGIGHDVTRYYQRAITITDIDKLADTMLTQLKALFVDE